MVFLIQSKVQKPSVEKFSRGENSVPHNGSSPRFFLLGVSLVSPIMVIPPTQK